MTDSNGKVLSVWIGGPLDGEERSDPRSEIEELLGRSIICGSSGTPAVYKADDQIIKNRLHLRFVKFVPPRKRGG